MECTSSNTLVEFRSQLIRIIFFVIKKSRKLGFAILKKEKPILQIVSLMRLLEEIFHPRFAGREGSTARRELISGSRSGWVGIGALRPENIRRVEKEGEERKVNKNLGEITVPGGGKLRLISCTRLSPSCLHLRSHSLTRSNVSPPLSRSTALSAVLYSTRRHEKEESLLLLRAVTTTYRPRKRRLKTVPDRRISLSSSSSPPPPPSSYSPLHLLASNGWCMQRYTRGLSFTSSRASSGTREFANRTRKIATPPSELVASFLHVRYPFDRNLVVKWGTRKGEERREYEIGREKRCQIFRINKNARFRGGKHSFSWPCERLRAGLALVQTSSLSLRS